MRSALLALCVTAVAACNFSGSTGGDGDGDDAGADAALCSELSLELTMNGEPVSVADNVFRNRITDVIELDTAGSCGRAPLTFEWSVPNEFAGDTGSGGGSVIRPFQVIPGASTISVSATDGTETASLTLNVTSVGIQQLPYAPSGDDNIEGMAIANGKLWFSAQDAGVYSLDLTDPHGAATLGEFLREDLISNDVGRPRQLFASGDTIWIRNQDNRRSLYSFDATVTNPPVTEIPMVDPAGQNNIEAYGFFAGGVRFTAGGSLFTWDGADFLEEVDDDAVGVVADATQLWTGDNLLRRANDGVEFDVNLAQDDQVRAIVIAADGVWAGGNGVARITDDMPTRYNAVTGVRALAVGSDGDLWAATSDGLWRYQRRRDRWHRIAGNATGLQNDNVRSIAIDSSGPEEVVYIGSDSSVHALTLRFSPP